MDMDASRPEADASAFGQRLTILIVLTVVLILEQGWQIFRGAATARQSWQYSIEAPPDAELAGRLQALGSAGWEIVSARRATTQSGGETTAAYEMILRRPMDASALAL